MMRLSMKKNKPQLSATPPKSVHTEAQNFIDAANDPERSGALYVHNVNYSKEEERKLPWENSGVRDDLIKIFNLRLSERYFLKLEYLSKMTRISKHQLCMDILLKEIDKKLNIK